MHIEEASKHQVMPDPHGRRRGSLVRNIVHLGLGQVATTVLTVMLSAVLARTLGASDFGLMYLLTTISTFAYVIIDWGYGPLIIREVARNHSRCGELMGSTMAVRSAGALVMCVTAFGITWLLGYDAQTRLLAAALILGLLPQGLGLSMGWAFRGVERMDRDAQINVIFKLTTLILSVTSLSLGGHLAGLVLAWTLAGSLTLVVGVAMYRSLDLPKLRVSGATARTLLRNGVPIFAMTGAIAVEPFFNANILYKVATPAVVGWYGAAWAVVGTLLAPATVLGGAMYPRMSAVVGDAAEFKRNFDMSFRPIVLIAVLGALGTFIFADVPIRLIYTEEKFGPAADNLRVSAPLMLLMYVDIYLATVALSLGKASRLAIAKVASVVICTGLVFVLIPLCQTRLGNGGLGVIYAMIIGEVLILIATCTLIWHLVDGRVIGYLGRSLGAGLATIALFSVLPEFTPLLAIPACVAVFAGLSMLVGALKRSDFDVLVNFVLKQAPETAPERR